MIVLMVHLIKLHNIVEVIPVFFIYYGNNAQVVLQMHPKYFFGGCIYLGLHNQINAVTMRRSNGSLFYHGCLSTHPHSFWTGKFINLWYLMISYRCRKCATSPKVHHCMGIVLALLRTGPYIGYLSTSLSVNRCR